MKRLPPFVCASVALHFLIFLAAAMAIRPELGIAGSSDGDPDRVFVVVVSEQDCTAVAPVPCPVDSPESTNSEKKQPEKSKERPELLVRETKDGPVPLSKTELDEIPEVLPEVDAQRKKQLDQQEQSQASDPQIASNRQMRRNALGQERHDFESKLLAAIRQSTFFPQEALKDKRYGQVTLAFAVNRDGTLSSVRVVNSSGSEVLDDAAQEILQKASKAFPVFPASVLEDSLAYSVPICFKERSSGAARTAAIR